MAYSDQHNLNKAALPRRLTNALRGLMAAGVRIVLGAICLALCLLFWPMIGLFMLFVFCIAVLAGTIGLTASLARRFKK